MNTNKIINTIVLVFFSLSAVLSLIQSTDASEFVSGFLHGICFVLALIFWAEDL